MLGNSCCMLFAAVASNALWSTYKMQQLQL